VREIRLFRRRRSFAEHAELFVSEMRQVLTSAGDRRQVLVVNVVWDRQTDGQMGCSRRTVRM